MIAYAQEKLAACRAEIEALVPQQWAEMAQGFDQFVEKPNWDFYLGLEAKGNALLFTARESGALIGWFGVYVYKSTTSDNLIVQATPYFVIPHRTRGIILRRLIKTAIAKVAIAGAMITIKTHPWASAAPILEHLGFRAVETWYMKAAPPGVTVPELETAHA